MINMDEMNIADIESNLSYLKLLSKQYPTIQTACTEIINLQAILNLPKGTEHFLSDIHGEYESFTHILKNASGVIKNKIDAIFGTTLTQDERKSLATLIYYPEQKLEIAMKTEKNIKDWYKITLYKLIEVCRVVSSKYTRSKVRKALPKDFDYIIEELLHKEDYRQDKEEYYSGIIDTIIKIERADAFIIAISKLIQRLVVDRLHIIGDIFDRGPGANIILDALIEHYSIDIQWGNHDILWMGAAAGSEVCIANAIRISAKYANIDIIEEGYGINMRPLATFALEFYKNDSSKRFVPGTSMDNHCSEKDLALISMMHKAITVIQFKLEAEVIKRKYPDEMKDRILLEKIDFGNGTISIDGNVYKLNDTYFPTIDPKDPCRLTEEERELVEKLKSSFINSEKLQKHVRFLFAKGSMYTKFNSNLLYHGCIPMNKDGTFKKVKIDNTEYIGKAYIDKAERVVRECYFDRTNKETHQNGLDYFWYMWAGENSPLFGKNKMTTFERYFIDDKMAHKEEKNPYYKFRDNEDICKMILEEFGLDRENSHIINGHVPVITKKGESPIKANGKLLVIDGGLSKAYQCQTGIAGYTLIYNSYGLLLVSHEPFESTQKAIEEEKDILSTTIVLEKVVKRRRVADTDIGVELKSQISDLQMLLVAYRKGLIKETKL